MPMYDEVRLVLTMIHLHVPRLISKSKMDRTGNNGDIWPESWHVRCDVLELLVGIIDGTFNTNFVCFILIWNCWLELSIVHSTQTSSDSSSFGTLGWNYR